MEEINCQFQTSHQLWHSMLVDMIVQHKNCISNHNHEYLVFTFHLHPRKIGIVYVHTSSSHCIAEDRNGMNFPWGSA